MVRSKSIITVDLDLGACLPSLFSHLKAQGYRLFQAATPADLLPVIEQQAGALIFVHNGPGQSTARQVLRALAGCRREFPVIVIAEQSDFEEYYDLMCAGAFDYFDLSGDPQWIEQSVRCATRAAAA